MRLEKIKIINFGQLSNLTFDLPSKELNVFFGQNEAGKSTTVAFIKQIMFGFYLRSNSAPFFEDYQPLAHVSPMGGSLLFVDQDGNQYELERLWAKGDKTKLGTLSVKKDGQLVPKNLFFDQIKNIDGNFYADSFIFNQEMLGKISGLSQHDLLERIYYLGATNSNKLLALRDNFTKQANDLFKKSGKKPEVNRLLKELVQNRQILAEKEQEFQKYNTVNQSLEQEKSTLFKQQNLLNQLQLKLQNLNKMKDQIKNFDQLQILKNQLRNIQFNSENYQKAQEVIAQRKNLQVAINSLQEKITKPQSLDFDFEKARKLVDKQSEILQWESEYQTCFEKIKQLNMEKERILEFNPQLAKIKNLSDVQIRQLQKDYQSLPKNVSIESEETDTSNKSWKIVGIILSVIALIEMYFNFGLSLIILILGMVLSIYNFLQQKQFKQKEQTKIKSKQLQVTQYKKFVEKYHLDPEKTNLNEILNQLNSYQLKEYALKNANDKLKNINIKCKGLAFKIESFINKPISENFSTLQTELKKIANVLENERQVRSQLVSQQINLDEKKQIFKELGLKLETLLANDQVSQMTEYNQRYQEFLKQAKIKMQIAALKNSLKDQLDKLEQTDLKQIRKQIITVKQTIDRQNEEIIKLQQMVAEDQVKTNNLTDSTAIFTARQALANKESEFLNRSKDYLANLMAANWISRALDIASNERFPKMLNSAKEYLKLLTGGRYVDLNLNKKITIIRFDGKKREVKYLSRATAEQLYFALKLAFVHQIKDKINLPILIDDSFVNFDDQRIGYIKTLLEKLSQNNQVLIFTAQKKLVNYLEIKTLNFKKGSSNVKKIAGL